MKVLGHSYVVIALIVGAAFSVNSAKRVEASIGFSTFVQSSDIFAAEGQTNTIGFTYAGNKFVGSLYFGPNNLQLYSTDLTGGTVTTFGSPLPSGSGEVVLAASLGLGGYPSGDIYAAAPGNSTIYHYANSGGAPAPFASIAGYGDARQIFFDPGSSFGSNMIVTTNFGNILKVNSAGGVSLIASVGEDTEGMDIAPSTWGSYAGQLLVASEGSDALRFVSPGGVVSSPVAFVPDAETVSFVPLTLGVSGNPLEGFYVANYAIDIQKAGASQFAGLQGHAIITSEFSSSSPVWDLFYDPVTNTFTTPTVVGTLPSQSEDGIFVTAERISDLAVPESASIVVWLGLTGIAVSAVECKRRLSYYRKAV